MYERNAIVLERFFEKTFGFNEINNLKVNYLNYRRLIENYEKYILATNAETQATEEFNAISDEIAKIQKTQEKLYNKGAKFEYSRYVIFNNIKEKPEVIQKYLNQIEDNIETNNNSLKELGSNFVSAINTYNEKKVVMEECQSEKAEAKENFEKILEIVTECYKNISEEYIADAKEFITSENKDEIKELTNIFTENGKNERNPFDIDVIQNTINVSISIYKIEIDIYLSRI
jgi:chaperonin cofactor prefoldin